MSIVNYYLPRNIRRTLLITFLMVLGKTFSQQIADNSFTPNISKPEYHKGTGPTVFIDEGHYNFHTKNGRYKAFSNLLKRDGYVIQKYKGAFTKKQLSEGKILVISNALHKSNLTNWNLPNPSAFTKNEIQEVKQWVQEGGSLFLIADHMPMAGAAKELAAAFEFEFTNGFVMDTLIKGPAYFSRKERTLIENTITNGRNTTEKVEQIATFTGQAFKIPADATPILIFSEQYINLLPDTVWVFNKTTPKYNVKGWSQGAYKKYGKGRIVSFGEAAMFTAQLAGPEKRKMGMNRDDAKENYKLLLNIIHWLDKKFD